MAINPTNADIIHVGGVNHWISTDGGMSFNCPSKWSTPYKKGYVHADIHDINYFGNDLWFAVMVVYFTLQTMEIVSIKNKTE